MTIINALGPVFLLVLLGIVLRRIDMPGRQFWPLAEKITYYLFFPALLIRTLASAPFSATKLGEVFVLGLGLLVVLSLGLAVLSRGLSVGGAAFTSIYQGAIRFNTYVGLAAASGLWGAPGLGAAAIIVAAMVPVVNVLSIAVFAFKLGRGVSLWRQVLLNPLILACLAGIGLNLSGIGLPGWSDALLEILSRPALPIGLLAIGAGLSYHGLRSQFGPVVIASVLKLLISPIVALGLCWLAGLTSPHREALVLIAALPTAPSAYILSRQLGGDAGLMAAITTLQTLLAFLTLPLVMVALTRFTL